MTMSNSKLKITQSFMLGIDMRIEVLINLQLFIPASKVEVFSYSTRIRFVYFFIGLIVLHDNELNFYVRGQGVTI